MMTLVAYGVIALWAGWCVLSDRVKDGVFGKLIYSAVSIAALAAILSDRPGATDHVFLFGFALIGIRHFVLKILKGRHHGH